MLDFNQAAVLGQAITARQVSVREAAEQALKAAACQKTKLNAWITVDPDQVLRQADDVQRRIDQGEAVSPLAGVPVAVKDNISTRGLRTTCGSRMLADYTPPFDATVVARLSRAGLVILGKTNLDEFAMGSTTETSWFGPTMNPWRPGHVPGGSSGGSAAATAAGQVLLALGSDTGGSIRQPCAWCGLTGLKPTYGTVSRYGLIAYASSLDQIGPMALTAGDCRILYEILAGPDSRDSTSLPDSPLPADCKLKAWTGGGAGRPLAGLTVGCLDDAAQVQPAVSAARAAAIRQLEALGASVELLAMPLLDEAVPAYYLIATAEASSNLARFDGIRYGYRPDDAEVADIGDYYARGRSEGFGREVRRRILLGTFALSAGFYDAWYLQALKVRRLVCDRYAEALRRVDLILSPVSATTAPPLGASLADPLAMYQSDRYTVAANLTGLPALALPFGQDSQGLPVGMQLTGPSFSDRLLLAAGEHIQSAQPVVRCAMDRKVSA